MADKSSLYMLNQRFLSELHALNPGDFDFQDKVKALNAKYEAEKSKLSVQNQQNQLIFFHRA